MTLAPAQLRSAVLRRTAGAVVVLGLLASAAVFYADASRPATPTAAEPITASTVPGPPDPSSADPTSTGPSSADPTSTAPSSADPSSADPSSADPTSPGPTSATPSPLPQSSASPTPSGVPRGPGTTEPGVLLVATPASDGSFDVSEMIRFTAPTSTLSLRPPEIAAAGHDFAMARPWASDVQVSAGEEVPAVADGRVSVPITVRFDNPTERIELRYRLRGVTVRSLPSRAGRALAAIGPITAALPAGMPVAVEVNGDAVRNLQCPTLPLPQQPCAAGALPRLQIAHALPRSKAVVIVQLDLPRPS